MEEGKEGRVRVRHTQKSRKIKRTKEDGDTEAGRGAEEDRHRLRGLRVHISPLQDAQVSTLPFKDLNTLDFLGKYDLFLF